MQQQKLKKNICNGITSLDDDGANMYFGGALNQIFVLNSNYETTKTIQIPSGVVDLKVENGVLAVNNFTNEIRIFKTDNLEESPKVIQATPCDSWKVRFSRNQKSVFTGGSSGTLYQYSLESGKEEKTDVFNKSFIQSLAVTKGDNIVLGSTEGNVCIVNSKLDKKTEIAQKLNFGIPIIENCIEEEKCYVVSADGKIYFLDLEKQQFMEDKLFEGHLDIVTDLTVQQSQNRFFTCSLDKTIKIWDERSGYVDSIPLDDECHPWGITVLEKNQEIVIGTEEGDFFVYDNY